MDQDVDNLLCVVVLEAGSTWPPWINEYHAVAPNSVVIAQAPEESPQAFGLRSCHRLEEISTGRAKLTVAVVVASTKASEEQLAQRHAICRMLVRAMASAPRSDLVLAGEGKGSDQNRHDLFALAGTLCDELRGSELSVSVRFVDGRPESGTMRSVSPVAISEAQQDADKEAIGQKRG